ncbi:MAG: aminotransferase class V-fold PLP-dependent enzyme [Clostridiales bacterium]|nr:MAG: aminotransferase class V-fold PLP-dependent enzyme [Clostridiales bacterium]
MFGADDPNRFIFTQNATESLNLAIRGFLKTAVTLFLTQMEHNSVIRPVFTLEKDGITHTVAEADVFGRVSPENVENAIRPDTKMIIATHVSNVCGTVNDIEKIGKIAKEHGIAFLIDAAQSAGVLPIDIKKQNITFLSLTGHKRFWDRRAPARCTSETTALFRLKTGGTGSYSKLPYQPDDLPDKYESGTLNTVGICGLNEGLKFIKKVGIENIFEHEMHLTSHLLENLSVMRGISVQGYMSASHRSGVVSITSDKKTAVRNIAHFKHRIRHCGAFGIPLRAVCAQGARHV